MPRDYKFRFSECRIRPGAELPVHHVFRDRQCVLAVRGLNELALPTCAQARTCPVALNAQPLVSQRVPY